MGGASQPTPSTKPALPAKRDANGLPAIRDEDCDVAIPARLFSAWKPDHGPRSVIRELTGHERALVGGRAEALREALRPFQASEQGRVNAEIAAMLGGFRSMRQQDEDVAATVEVARHVLREFPLWAISRGCLMIAQRKTDLDRKWPPNDGEIYGVVEDVVEHFRKRLASAEALLAAPVEPPEPVRPTQAEIEAALGRPVSSVPSGLPEKPAWHGDGKHAQRVEADLAARRARREMTTGSE